ncbi:ABC transporter ATP-binding protein/permease [Amycolatopsis roodepoortensis]|uniref:ABC transporter ATP-binding protein n=1 Tax=Amycolatopsis roodepoortensis TaxID=700274 RepID=UPI00214BAA9A|nr:ABC transporter ATP-binding protein [Amycolatopsis roodepoortensis]UUV31578.1 ABC transporter ATP-binding protein/permease [Amycolatopsis roodepoortensis]
MTALVGLVWRRAGRWLRILSLLRYVPPATLAMALLLNVLLGLLPIGFVVAMSVLLQRVPAAIGGDPAAWTALLAVLAVAGAAFGLQQTLAPFQAAAGELVMRHVDGRCRVLLMRAALVDAPAMALDDPELLDDVNAAREAFDRASASPGDAAAGAVALVARYTQLVGAVVLVGITLSPLAAVVIGVTAVVIRFGQRGSLGKFGDFYDGLAGERRKVSYVKALASGPRAAKEIRLLGLVDWLRDRHRRDDLGYLRTMWRGRRALLGPPFLWLSAAGLVGATVVFLLLAGHGGLSLLELGIALQSVLILMRFGVYFPECDVQTQYGSLAYEALLAFRDKGRSLRPLESGLSLPSDGLPRRSIRFHDVGFRYRPDGREVLAGLDLEVQAGTSLAVVGLNGAGKTTLVKLLTRLYDPTSGRISVDGRDLRDIEPRDWHRRLAVIFQDYVRYELSFADNIALGAPEFDASDEDLLAAARRAGAAEMLGSMPDGPRTVLSRQYEGGRDLSGGQWQRVALARALHAVNAGASVMVLDEPTAQLDVRAEVEFFDRFLDITRGLTTVIISHRFSTVRRADQIVVLEHGRVAERGTHDQLLAAGGRYATLFRLQAERFTDETAPPVLESTMDEVS